jgi:20S proteasome subunit beta 4
MMEKGIEEVRRRLVVAAPKFIVKVVDANGIRTVAELTA